MFFFTLKKILTAFVMPLPIGLMIVLVGLVLLFKKRFLASKIVLILGFLWIFIFSFSPVTNLLIASLEEPYRTKAPSAVEPKYIVILGHGHQSDEQIGIDAQLSSIGTSRVLHGYMLSTTYPKAKFITTGYGGKDKIPYANKAKELLIALGIKPDKITAIPTARDTAEEASMVKAMVGDEGVVLVTSASHMKRASALFAKAKVNITPNPAQFTLTQGGLVDYPSSDGLHKSETYFHENLGILFSTLKGDIE